MEVEEKLNRYKETFRVQAKESSVKKTVEQCKQVFYEQEQDRLLSGKEFLYIQLGYIRKRWWILQGLLLVALWESSFLYQRTFVCTARYGSGRGFICNFLDSGTLEKQELQCEWR